MNIRIIDDYSGEKINPKPFRRLIQILLDGERISIQELNIIFVNDEYLRKLHHEFLHENSYTDVLTFSLSDSGAIDAEIYISVDRAKLQAKQYDVSLQDEIARLIIHGILHLKGFEDQTQVARQEMHQLENKWLRHYWQL